MADALSGNVAKFGGFNGMESVLTCAKPVEHVVAGCVARVDGSPLIPISAVDINWIDHGRLLCSSPTALHVSRIRSRSTIARLDSRAEDADTAWSDVQCKRAGGVAIRPCVAASDPNIEDPERPSSSFPRRPHGEPDLLTKGELERMAVGVGNPRGIADGVARIDRSACRSALAAGLGI
jgi:hypothetical protein